MKVSSIAWLVVWLTHAADAFVALPSHPVVARSSASASSSLVLGLAKTNGPPSPDELRARAAAIREELKELEADAAITRRPNADLIDPRPVRPGQREVTALNSTMGVEFDSDGGSLFSLVQ